MEVNLCPSLSSGQISCSIRSEISDSVFVKEENLAVVELGLEHCVAVVCCDDGETQYNTISTSSKEDFPDNIHGSNYYSSPPSTPNRVEVEENENQPHKQKITESPSVRKKFKQWSETAMALAIEQVRCGMKIRAAAEKFKVPRSTLGDRLLMAKYGCRTSTERGHKRGRICYVEDHKNIESPRARDLSKSYCTSSTVFQQSEGMGIINGNGKMHEQTIARDITILSPESSPLYPTRNSAQNSARDTTNDGPEIANFKLLTTQNELALTGGLYKAISEEPAYSNESQETGEILENWDCESDDEIKAAKRFRMWSEKDMIEAVRAVREEGMALRTASKTFSVPRTTLSQWVSRGDGLSRIGGKKKWSEEKMNQALEAIRSSDMPVRVAARKFEIPKSTLYDRILREDETEIKNYRESVKINQEGFLMFPDIKRTCDITSPNFKNNNINITNEYNDTIFTTKGFPCSDNGTGANNNTDSSFSEEGNETLPVITMVYSLQNQDITPTISDSSLNEQSVNVNGDKKLEAQHKKQECSPTDDSTKHELSPSSKVKVGANNIKTNPQELIENVKRSSKRSRGLVVRTERKKWTEEAMLNAILEVENGSCIRNAAGKFGVPRSTLGDRVISYRKNGYFKGTERGSFGLPNHVEKAEIVNETSEENMNQESPEVIDIEKETETETTSSWPDSFREQPVRHSPRLQNSPGYLKKLLGNNMIKGKRKNKIWTEENMSKAIDAVEQGMPVRHASKQFSVPRTTLSCRKLKREQTESIYGPTPHLSREDEDKLISYVNHCASFGFRNVKKVALMLAQEAAIKSGVGGALSDKWWDSFCCRNKPFLNHPVLGSDTRIREETNQMEDVFYERFHSVLISSGVLNESKKFQEERIFTVQEVKYDILKINANMGVNDAKYVLQPGTSEAVVSTICCVSAVGSTLPPMFVYDNADGFQSNPLHEPQGSAHCCSSESDIYVKWFRDLFLKHKSDIHPQILLLDPNTSFITPALIKMAHENNVFLLCFAPHPLELGQPISRTVVPALKNGLRNAVSKLPSQTLSLANFSTCFKHAWDSSVDATVISLGFRLAGISQFNIAKYSQDL